jgi:hypothetical protein
MSYSVWATTTTSFFFYPFLSLYRPVQIRSTAAERESGGQPAHRLVSPSVFILFLQQKCGKFFFVLKYLSKRAPVIHCLLYLSFSV